MRRIKNQTLHSAISAPAVSDPILVEDFRHLTLLLLAAGATGNVKVKLSDATEPPNFANPSTVANPWYYSDLKGLSDGGTTVTGTTGVALSTTTNQRGYAVNVDNARWMAVDVEALSVGSLSVLFGAATNE